MRRMAGVAEERQPPAKNMYAEIFAKYTEADIFEAMIEGFHNQLENQPQVRKASWKAMVSRLRPLAQEIPSQQGNEYFEKLLNHSEYVENFPDHRKLYGAAWRFVALHYAVPGLVGSIHVRIEDLTLTELGLRVCQRKPQENPTRPGYIERLRGANSKIEEEVFERLIDALACLEAGLGRPAIVMLGIAAEITTANAYSVMKQLGVITKTKDAEFREQLAAIVAQIDNVQALTPDQRHRLKMAFVAVESLRVLRNNAAHHGKPSPDLLLAYDQLAATTLHLLPIWTELILPNQP